MNNTIKRCAKCRLNKARIHDICSEGNLGAKLMLVAQAPGVKEDEKANVY